MISINEAIEIIIDKTPVSTAREIIHLSDAYGRVALPPIISRLTQPPCDVSAMDGWAICSPDPQKTDHQFTIIGESIAGHGFSGDLQTGQAVRIFTGAPVPQNADTILLQEDAVRSGDILLYNKPIELMRNIRTTGSDFSAKQTLIASHQLLTSRDLALIAASGNSWLDVIRRPRVAIISTGSELVRLGDEIGKNNIINSNVFFLSALIKQAGGQPVDCGIAPDNQVALSIFIKMAATCDIIVTIGGASVGDYDLVNHEFKQLGVDLHFSKVAIRPGKPVLFGSMDNKLFLGLPGNPTSAFVCAYLFLRPMIELYQGLPYEAGKTFTAKITTSLGANGNFTSYLRAKIYQSEDGWQASPVASQDSSLLYMLASSNGFIIRQPQEAKITSGDEVECLIFTGNI